MKAGDLVRWSEGHCDIPGIVIEIKPARGHNSDVSAMNPSGMAVLAMLPELNNDLEWFHECELEVVNESR